MSDSIQEIVGKVNAERKYAALQFLSGHDTAVREGLSTGSVSLNMALAGTPYLGYVWGRIVEIFSDEGKGKTTLALHLIREAQKRGYPCAYIDAEHALDPVYMGAIGVNLEELPIHQPNFGEEAIEVLRSVLTQGIKVIVVDSVAALTPKAELEGDTGDSFMGKHARLMSQAMRQTNGLISQQKAIVLFINQTRMKIGVMFGDPTTTTGGKALAFYASYRLQLTAPRSGAEKERLDDGEVVETGIDVNVKIIKNKLFPPFRSSTIHIDYGKGINKVWDIAKFATTHLGDGGNVEIGGKVYNEKKLRSALESKEDIRESILEGIKSKYPLFSDDSVSDTTQTQNSRPLKKGKRPHS